MDGAVRFEDPAVLYTNRTAEDKPSTKPADVQSDFEKYLEKSGVGKGFSLELRERTWSPDLYYFSVTGNAIFPKFTFRRNND